MAVDGRVDSAGNHRRRYQHSPPALIRRPPGVNQDRRRHETGLVRCRWDNPLIAAGAEGYEPEDRSSGKLAVGGLP
jgi:hypothetical protein